MSGAYSTANDVDVDLRRLFGSLAQKWRRILLVSLLVTGAAFAFAWLSTPHYKAETRLLIETGNRCSPGRTPATPKATSPCSTRRGSPRRSR